MLPLKMVSRKYTEKDLKHTMFVFKKIEIN